MFRARMAFPLEAVHIVSDEDDDEAEDFQSSSFSVRPVQPTSHDQSGSPFNIQTVPIGGALHTKSSYGSTHNRMDGTGLITHEGLALDEEDEYSSEEIPTFARKKKSPTTVNLSDYEQNDTESKDSKQKNRHGVPYRTTDYKFGDDEPPPELQEKEILQMKKRNVILNVFLLGVICLFQSVGFLLFFPDILLLNVGKVTTQHVALMVLCLTCAVSALTSLVIINLTGERWAIFIGTVGTAFFTCARIFDTSSFIITASVLAGLGQGIYMVATFAYLYQLGAEYSSLTGQELQNVICYFSAYLHAWLLAAPFISSLLRYIFLMDESYKSFHDVSVDTKCGSEYCWTRDSGMALFEVDSIHSRSATDTFRLQGLLGAFLVCSLGAAFLAWSSTTEEPDINQLYQNRTLARQAQVKEEQDRETCSDIDTMHSLQLLLKPFQCFLDQNIILLVPLFIFLGYQEMLGYSVLVQTFTQCSSNLTDALLVAAILSVTSAILSLPIGVLVSYVGKVKVMLPALLIILVILVTLIVRDPPVKYHYVIAAFWGMSDSILQSVVIVICTSMSTERCEAVIACSRACQVLGYLTVSLLQLAACNWTVLVFSICLLLLSALTYVAMEIKVRLDVRAAMEVSSQYVPLQTEASWIPRVNPVNVRPDRTESLTLPP